MKVGVVVKSCQYRDVKQLEVALLARFPWPQALADSSSMGV